MSGTATCAYCGGTGKVYLNRSMFVADGYRSERCGVCKGSGKSRYRPAPDVVRQMKNQRDKALAPIPPPAAPGHQEGEKDAD